LGKYDRGGSLLLENQPVRRGQVRGCLFLVRRSCSGVTQTLGLRDGTTYRVIAQLAGRACTNHMYANLKTKSHKAENYCYGTSSGSAMADAKPRCAKHKTNASVLVPGAVSRCKSHAGLFKHDKGARVFQTMWVFGEAGSFGPVARLSRLRPLRRRRRRKPG